VSERPAASGTRARHDRRTPHGQQTAARRVAGPGGLGWSTAFHPPLEYRHSVDAAAFNVYAKHQVEKRLLNQNTTHVTHRRRDDNYNVAPNDKTHAASSFKMRQFETFKST